MIPGVIFAGFEGFVSKGKLPFTLRHKVTDSKQTMKSAECSPIEYPPSDGKLSFDLLMNLQRSGTFHEDSEPCHLRVKPELEHVPKKISYQQYGAPETRFCPARVYEYITDDDEKSTPQLVINSQNCLHCKCCSIKMPYEYIDWTVPQGGGGPKYESM